ncbi:MAG: murein biosynthesis integral membrane protein MurJ [Myxococcota bacterium]
MAGTGDGSGGTARRIGWIALALSASVALSRLLGFVREAVLARVLGVSAEADAYYAAFMLPDLLNYFLAGGALSLAFIPLYTQLREREGQAVAQLFFANVLGVSAGLATLATVVLFLAAEALVALQFPRFGPEQTALTVRLTRILLPAQIFFIAGGVIKGALMSHDRFVAQSLAPLVYNAAIIVGGVFFGAQFGAEGFAWGALVGAVLGPFGLAIWEARRVPVLSLGLRFALRDPALHRYLKMALPLMLGVTLLTVDEWYDKWFGGLLVTGSVAALSLARRLMLLPVAVVGQAIATAAMPALSRLHAEGRHTELDALLLGTLRAGVTLACLGGAATFALAEPLVAFVYEGGAFDAAAAKRVTLLLQVFALGVPAWIAQQIGVRGFYARGDTWRPMWLGTAIAVAAAGLYYGLGQRFGAVGLAWAGVLGISANALAMLGLLRRVHGGPPLGPFFASAARALGVATLAGAVTAWIPPLGGEGTLGALMQGAAGGAVFAAVALPALWAVGDDAQREALAGIGRRLGRRRG